MHECTHTHTHARTQTRTHARRRTLQVDLSTDGTAMFKNFLFGIAGLTPTFTMVDRRAAAIAEIRAIVGEDEARCPAALPPSPPSPLAVSPRVPLRRRRGTRVSVDLRAACMREGRSTGVCVCVCLCVCGGGGGGGVPSPDGKGGAEPEGFFCTFVV